MHRFASIRDKELRRRLTPDYDFGCKRPTFSNGYYRTFNKTACAPAGRGIERIEADGIVATDGTKTVIDTLVLATGFDLWEANFPAIEVIGRDGPQPRKVVARHQIPGLPGRVTMPYFPNYLSLASPYAFLGLNFFNTMEYQMRHMDRLFGEVKRRGATTFEVTEDANTRYLDRMTELLGDSVFIRRQLRDVAVVLLQPQGRGHPAAAPVDAHRDQGSLRVPIERLSDCVIREETSCASEGQKQSRGAQIAGLALAGTGLAHFARPELFESITKAAFPRNTRQNIYINGGIETALGLALASSKTRRLAAVGAIGYVAYLAGNVARNR